MLETLDWDTDITSVTVMINMSREDNSRSETHLWQVSNLLSGLRRMAEPVRSIRLQTFLTVLNFHPLSR